MNIDTTWWFLTIDKIPFICYVYILWDKMYKKGDIMKKKEQKTKKEVKKKNKGGRPTKYKKEYDRIAYAACSDGGATDVSLSKIFGIRAQTLSIWKRELTSFREAIQKGRDEYDVATAENCLKKRIEGFDYEEVVKEMNPATGKMEVVRSTSKKVIPDAHSLKFFLRNRERVRWADTNKVEVGVSQETIDHADRLVRAREAKSKVKE